MIRRLPPLALLLTAAPALAATEPPYYGPAKPWHGIGFKFGYDEKVEKDGDWRITAAVRHGEALDMAMYRAAEKARAAGYSYVQFLRGVAGRMPGMGTATVWARPAATAEAPAGCAPAKAGSCYTADVAGVLRVLGGPGGTQPGVAIVDHYDRFGRPVTLSGFGIGATDGRAAALSRTTDGRIEIRQTGTFALAPRSAAPPAPLAAAMPPAYTPVPAGVEGTVAATGPTDADEAQAQFDAARRRQQGARGRSAGQGWTISD